ncbi:unnamed protein product [Sphagnum balticum]
MAQETKTAAGQVLYYVVMVVLSTLGVSFAAWSLHLARARARRERSSSALAAGVTDATLEARANNIEEATLPGK